MSETQRLLLVGVTGETNVYANVLSIGSDVPVSVTLSADYTMLDPPGFPSRPSFTGAATPQYPHTVPEGSVLLLLACEANALVTAGGATLNG